MTEQRIDGEQVTVLDALTAVLDAVEAVARDVHGRRDPRWQWGLTKCKQARQVVEQAAKNVSQTDPPDG